VLAAVTAAASAGGPCNSLSDPAGDAILRRTDPGNDGAVSPTAALPDVISISLCGWQPADPATDPYTGTTVSGDDAHIFRLQVVLAGLVNPPGELLVDPFQFGPSPVYGFVELDVDDDKDTGGELGGAALQRYLANVGRFGKVPYGAVGERAAESGIGFHWDWNFYSDPQYERSGADFALVLCGCEPAVVVSEGGDGDGQFEADETWVIRGRLWQRAAGYQEASGVVGGSAPGLYDPLVNLQWKHENGSTTVTLVEALDMQGAADLPGQPVQGVDQLIDVWSSQFGAISHHSVQEALRDLVLGAEGLNGGPLHGPVEELTERWDGRNVLAYLDPADWRVTALVGTPYLDQSEELLAWTDTAGRELLGDFDAGGSPDAIDQALFDAAVAQLDGSSFDEDGLADGVVDIVNFGPNFSVYDLDGDGVINGADRLLIASCRADWNNSGAVNSQDYFDFLLDFFASPPSADFNGDSVTNSQDYFDFLAAFFAGCP
jgi:hypothetical protein